MTFDKEGEEEEEGPGGLGGYPFRMVGLPAGGDFRRRLTPFWWGLISCSNIFGGDMNFCLSAEASSLSAAAAVRSGKCRSLI